MNTLQNRWGLGSRGSQQALALRDNSPRLLSFEVWGPCGAALRARIHDWVIPLLAAVCLPQFFIPAALAAAFPSTWKEVYPAGDTQPRIPVGASYMAFGNGTFVAARDNGTILRSSDGGAWEQCKR